MLDDRTTAPRTFLWAGEEKLGQSMLTQKKSMVALAFVTFSSKTAEAALLPLQPRTSRVGRVTTVMSDLAQARYGTARLGPCHN